MQKRKDREKLVKATQEDSTIVTWKKLADNGLRGYHLDDIVLLKATEELSDTRHVIVVPLGRRENILKLVHDRGGHLGSMTVKAMIQRHFTWPRCGRDVARYFSSCEVCHIVGKSGRQKAPMVARPALTEPLEEVAFDLGGPLPKGKEECRFILTYICMASRWPDAITLSSITAKYVVRALVKIICRTGIPVRLLTDQGSQFVGRLVCELADLLQIDKVQTTAYHPESNGMMERMHITLSRMLAACKKECVDWVDQLLLVLAALWQCPSKSTGSSPNELVYDRNVQGTPGFKAFLVGSRRLNRSGRSWIGLKS